jgi:hypothetical protein
VSTLAKEIGVANYNKGNFSLWQNWPRVSIFLFSDFLPRERGHTCKEREVAHVRRIVACVRRTDARVRERVTRVIGKGE